MPKAQGSAVLGALTDTGEQASAVTPRCGARTIIGKVSSIKKKPAFNPTQAFIATALDDCIGARLCENLGSQIARRRSFSISVSLKNERTDGRHRGKTIEKTMLRVLGSCTFSHSLGQHRKQLTATRSFRSAPNPVIRS